MKKNLQATKRRAKTQLVDYPKAVIQAMSPVGTRVELTKKPIKDMTQEEINSDHKKVSQAFGIPEKTIEQINYKAACIYVMSTMIDDYIEFITNQMHQYGIFGGSSRFAMQDVKQASKQWSKAFALMTHQLEDKLKRDPECQLAKMYEMIRDTLKAFFEDGQNMENWNWEQRYYFAEQQKNTAIRDLTRQVAEAKQQYNDLLDQVIEQGAKITIK